MDLYDLPINLIGMISEDTNFESTMNSTLCSKPRYKCLLRLAVIIMLSGIICCEILQGQGDNRYFPSYLTLISESSFMTIKYIVNN